MLHNMKKEPLMSAFASWGATVLVAVGAAATATAATPLNGVLTLRPLTSTDQGTYKLSSLQKSAGINTVGLGSAVYLDALVNNAAVGPHTLMPSAWAFEILAWFTV